MKNWLQRVWNAYVAYVEKNVEVLGEAHYADYARYLSDSGI